MPAAFKKYLFVVMLLAGAGALALGRPGWGLALLSFLFAWLAWETHERRRFAFIADRRCPETMLDLGPPVEALAVSQGAPWALLVQAGPTVSLWDLAGKAPRWSRTFGHGVLALLARPDGRLLWAGEDRLHLCGPDGRDLAQLPFEAPLYRQSYKLLLSTDGGRALLHTPWFIQAFDPDLGSLGPRLRFEDAGHYMKYAVLSPEGTRLYTGGALLLDEDDSGGAAMEARWDAWDLRDGGWTNAWRQANQGYSNSHLRGLSLSADGSVLCAELWKEGYEFRLQRGDGSEAWRRVGERPVLSPDGRLVLWETREGMALGRVEDRQKLFSRDFEHQLRLKALAEDGRSLLLAGRRLFVLGPGGEPVWRAWFKSDPEHLGLGPGGRLAVAQGGRAACLRLPWPA